MTIEEIKKSFEEEFGPVPIQSDNVDKNLILHEHYDGGSSQRYVGHEVWNFFLPHLQPTEAERKVAQKIYDWLETEWYGRSELQTRIKLTYLAERGKK